MTKYTWTNVSAARDNPPVADAGNDVTIQLPTNTAILDGSASSDDLGIVQYEWYQLAGNRAQLDGEDTARLSVGNLEAGNYSFRLTVYDGLGQFASDTVNINVEGKRQ